MPLEGFMAKINQPCAEGLVEHINLFMQQVNAKSQETVPDSQQFQMFMAFMERAFAEHPLWAGCSSEELGMAVDSLKQYLTAKLYNRTLAQEPKDQHRDQVLAARLSALQPVQSEQLELAPGVAAGGSLVLTQQELPETNLAKGQPQDSSMASMTGAAPCAAAAAQAAVPAGSLSTAGTEPGLDASEVPTLAAGAEAAVEGRPGQGTEVGAGVGAGLRAGVGAGLGEGVRPGELAGVGPGFGAGLGPGAGAGLGTGFGAGQPTAASTRAVQGVAVGAGSSPTLHDTAAAVHETSAAVQRHSQQGLQQQPAREQETRVEASISHGTPSPGAESLSSDAAQLLDITMSNHVQAVLPECHVCSPWFEHIVAGTKTVEGRLFRGTFAELAPGSNLKFNSSDGASAVARVMRVNQYASFQAYLEAEGLAVTLPGIESIDEGVRVYRQFYSEAQEQQHGVAAVHITMVSHKASHAASGQGANRTGTC